MTLPGKLTMRVEQSSSFLMNFIEDLKKGMLLPAAFQRPYVWTETDIEAFCDSVLSGFPVGSVLLWSPGRNADLKSIAKDRIGSITMGSAEQPALLLDGQNRLATLAWMMMRDDHEFSESIGIPEHERAIWMNPDQQLMLDFETKSIRFFKGKDMHEGLKMPAWMAVLPATETHKKLRQLWNHWEESGFSEHDIEQFFIWYDNVVRAFMSAKVTYTNLIDATLDEARHAFIRICRVGVPMSQADFDQAIGWQAN